MRRAEGHAEPEGGEHAPARPACTCSPRRHLLRTGATRRGARRTRLLRGRCAIACAATCTLSCRSQTSRWSPHLNVSSRSARSCTRPLVGPLSCFGCLSLPNSSYVSVAPTQRRRACARSSKLPPPPPPPEPSALSGRHRRRCPRVAGPATTASRFENGSRSSCDWMSALLSASTRAQPMHAPATARAWLG